LQFTIAEVEMRRNGLITTLLVLLGTGCATIDSRDPTPASSTPSNEPTQVIAAERGVIPVGQEFDVRLQDRLDSGTATVEQGFETTTVVDLLQDGEVLVPAGSTIHGLVRTVDPAGRLDRSGRLTLAFDQLSIRGRNYRITALPTQAFESGGIREEGRSVGAGGAVGAIVGGILGGLRGALLGAAVGAGGVVAATEGKDVVLPAGTVIRIRVDSPVRLR
jgi:hypothetical protein